MSSSEKKHPFPLGLEMFETQRVMRRHFDRRMRPMGFTQAQWRALLRLDSNPGISQVGLADLLEMQPISLMRILERMEAAGLVERQPDPNDRRAVKLFLTEAARPTLKIMHEVADEIRAAAIKGVSDADQDHLTAVLQRMRANINALDNDTPLKTASQQ
jgi:MarR family transcriptional regulator for hemolysin